MQGPTSHFYFSQRLRLHYVDWGNEGAEPLLLVHGGRDHCRNWDWVANELREQYHIIAPDLRGHGDSQWLIGGTYTLLDYVYDIAQLIEQMHLSPVTIIGHSLGGAIALQTAISNTDKVDAVTLIGSAGIGEEINGGYISGFVAAESRREMKPLLKQLVGDPGLVNRKMIDDILKFKRLDGVTEALIEISSEFLSGDKQTVDLRGAIADLPMPVNVIWGSEDQIIPAAHASGLPDNVTVNILDGFGHLVQLEAASDVNKLLQS